MTNAQHEEMLHCLLGLKGYVVLSGYENDMYDNALQGWIKSHKDTYADGASKRVETLYINPQAAYKLQNELGLFQNI